MKKLSLFIAIAGIATLASCHRGNRHTIVSTNNNGNRIELEYSGNILLTNDNNGIQSISRGGYVKYTHNDEKILVEPDGGRIAYTLNGGYATFNPSNNDKHLLNEAIAELKKHGH